ncbi:MAG: DinB family protein [Hydrogenophilaceae bacterium]|jgi:hypothetical protein|nr:DinB family protein [Hydrogenophilaceae bacterium]
MVSAARLPILRRQFELTWRLAVEHLPALTDAMCLWRPAPGAWTVRQGDDGAWRPDWADAEPSPAPPVTIAWLTWHMDWWWSGLISAVRNEPQRPRECVHWPGSAALVIARLDALAADWKRELDRLAEPDLESPLAYPWPAPRPLGDALAWTNVELTKNVAEIGMLRHIYQAQR